MKGGSAGHSATAEVIITGVQNAEGWFSYTTFGEDQETDDIVTVSAAATNLEVNGELVPSVLPGSTVTATASSRAAGDETLAFDGLFVETEVYSQVELNLQPEAQGSASATAEGTARGSGNLPGVGVVMSESKGSTSATAESEGNAIDPVNAAGRGQVFGRSELQAWGAVLLTDSVVSSEATAVNGAEVEATAEGSAKDTAESPVFSGSSGAEGYSYAFAADTGTGTAQSRSQVYGFDYLDQALDLRHVRGVMAASSETASLDGGFVGDAESFASGDAEASGEDATGLGVFSMDSSADGGAWSAVGHDGIGDPIAIGTLIADSIQSVAGANGQYGTVIPGPVPYDMEALFVFTGQLADISFIRGWVDLDNGVAGSFETGGASAWGGAETDTEFGSYQSQTSVDGSASAGADANDASQMEIFGEVSAFNFFDGTTTVTYNGVPAGSFDTVLMSGSTVRTYTLESAGDVAGGGFGAGEAETTGTYDDGAIIAESRTMADGIASGAGALYSAEIAGISAAGTMGDSGFVAPVPFGEFVTADSGIAVSQYRSLAAVEQSSEGSASGKAGASTEMTTPVLGLAASSDVSGTESVETESENAESFTRAIDRGSVRSYYDPATNDGFVTSLSEAYALANGAGGLDSSTDQEITLAKLKASGEGSFTEDFTIESSTALAGAGSVVVKTQGAADSWGSARISSFARTRHDLTGAAERAELDAYYQAYTNGVDEAVQTVLAQMSGVTIIGKAEGVAEEGSLSLKKGSAKIDLKTASNKVKLTFPVKLAKMSGEPDPGYGAQQKTETQNSVTAPQNFAWAQWRAALDTNVALPGLPAVPQP